MDIKLARIDNRLLHGVVASQWAPVSQCDRVMVIDDVVANDPAKKDAMRISKPAGKALSIISTETAVTNFKSGRYEGKNILLIVKKPAVLKVLKDNGISIEKINLGGSAFLPDETIEITKRVFVSEADLAIYHEFQEAGTVVSAQYTPSDNEQLLTK
ncbi:PTS system mannose/fructose/N-acetylgalactosamine-transporter subunit IIB [Enterococcus diestrammenae]|uniref:PTS system mannose/fructose/N-acetylgalactosamine-transporter subunit IIB n=1 Tax=Enterococcus diestrammenae TaxID=1155073 RepID=UPI00195B4688